MVKQLMSQMQQMQSQLIQSMNFCEPFLTDEISDSELIIPDFIITRCDRRQRMGGGVCMYVKKLC